MCLGMPVQVVEERDFMALCQGPDGLVEVNMMLTGPQPVGQWVVNYLGSAREVLEEADALRILAAMAQLQAAVNGDPNANLDLFFEG
ncbi:hydrogenase assembly chaperone hypC/hupF [Magnetococcus marinus MC-1]|uniref:Hydrogenase assembly chaperone hypC/hupF n=1 Tax=Magnetococcus marinus (strain ATCC BAA-1437 / JCM 17883 / MC-1) TaxID=156889 RepID=A0LAK8_MAGMM|nr:HypC/HybG/HupF family hydrogenase formation chaperone [Magnetococcus marinus]ABK45001.1 hydrogenase assembly chaperone hypC/hupF [Magnetococcus marinus MC-1]